MNEFIVVLTQATVWVLKRKIFQQIMMRTRMQDIEVKVNYLRSIPLLKDLNVETLSKISDLLEVVRSSAIFTFYLFILFF